jgi:hypothetical protein
VILPAKKAVRLKKCDRLKDTIINEIGNTIIRRRKLKMVEENIENTSILKKKAKECSMLKSKIDEMSKPEIEMSEQGKLFIDKIRHNVEFMKGMRRE